MMNGRVDRLCQLFYACAACLVLGVQSGPPAIGGEIDGSVTVRGNSDGLSIEVGCLGLNPLGKIESAGVSLTVGSAVLTGTDKGDDPRNSTFSWNTSTGFGKHQHVNRPRGYYLVYARGYPAEVRGRIRREGYLDWAWVELTNDGETVKADLVIDPSKEGSVSVTIAGPTRAKSVTYLPLNTRGIMPLSAQACHAYFRESSRAAVENGKAVVRHLRPGNYHFAVGKADRSSPVGYSFIAEAQVVVQSGKTAEVVLTPK